MAVAVAFFGVIAAWLVVPEVRRALHLDEPVPNTTSRRLDHENVNVSRAAAVPSMGERAVAPTSDTSAIESRAAKSDPVSYTAPLPEPSGQPVDPRCTTVNQPVLAQKGTPEPYAIGAEEFVRYRLTILNRHEYSRELFAPAPDLAPCGLNTESSRTWVGIHRADTDEPLYGFCALIDPASLDDIWFATRHGEVAPRLVYVTFEDRRCGNIHRSNTINIENL